MEKSAKGDSAIAIIRALLHATLSEAPLVVLARRRGELFTSPPNRRLGRFIRLSFSLSMATQSQPVMSADETMSLPCFISPRASPWANPRNHISCQHTRSCCSIFCSIYFMNCIISQLHTVTVEPHSTTRLIYLSFCWVIYNHFWFFVSFKVLHGKFSSRRATTTKKSFFFFWWNLSHDFYPTRERSLGSKTCASWRHESRHFSAHMKLCLVYF